MPKLSRKGDKNTTGGKIVRGAETVFANGIAVGLHVSEITPHEPWGKQPHPPHKQAKTTEGSPTVFAEGDPVLRVGSPNTCGHKIVEGSENVFVP
jgi:uncharacterized Zn-binding protein involved in type VI secretion